MPFMTLETTVVVLATAFVACSTLSVAARSTHYEHDLHLQKLCRTMEKNGVVSICTKDVESLRPLSPVMLTSMEDESERLHLYPNMYYLRPRRAQLDPPVVGCRNSEALTLLRVTEQESNELLFPVSTLENLIQTQHIPPRVQAPTLRQDFDACVDSGLSPNANHSQLLERAQGSDAPLCKEIATKIFSQYGALLQQASSREDINKLLTRIATDWGSTPSGLAALLLLFGCEADESYDEFLSCGLNIGDIMLDVNVHQRNVDPDDSKSWHCETCGIHQHPRWYASYVVAGTVTYTMTIPECVSHLDENVATVEELDRNLAAGPTLLDKLGTRYHMGRTDVVWETTEVVDIHQGQSLLFPPNWYHRLVPPSSDATHTPITLVAKFVKDPQFGTHFTVEEQKRRRQTPPYVLKPLEVDVDTTQKWLCYRFVDLIYALRNPELNPEQGLELLPCASNGELYDPEGDWGNLNPNSRRDGEL